MFAGGLCGPADLTDAHVGRQPDDDTARHLLNGSSFAGGSYALPKGI